MPLVAFLRTLRLPTKITLAITASLTLLSAITLLATHHLLTASAEQRAEERQEANMRVAWDVLHGYGRRFALADGRLVLDGRPLEGVFAPVDRVKRLVGGTATIFSGDRRIATNVRNPDGSRAIGTTLTSDAVRDAVLVHGRPYRGRADILGRSFFTAYDPIKDAGGRIIGILYVGIPADDFLADVRRVGWQMALTGVLVTLAITLLCLMFTRRMFAPLLSVCSATDAMAAGRLDTAVPAADRGDEIGSIARAVIVFRDVSIAKQVADAEQRTVVTALATALGRVAQGDLTTRIDADFPAGYAKLKTDFDAALSALDRAMAAIGDNGGAMRGGLRELGEASDDLARRTEHNAASLEESAAALDDVTARIRATATQAADVGAAIANATRETAAGGAVVQGAIVAMRGIENSSSEINGIIGVIDGIAFQTNLLALNAGVEAARAGSAGAGFGVVATEVRALAGRSADAAREIKALIASSTAQVEAGAALVDDAGSALECISTQIEGIGALVGRIAQSTVEQSTGLRVVNDAISGMSDMTQQSAAMVEQSNAVTHRLAADAETLAKLIAHFRTEAASARPAAPPFRRAA